MTLLMVLPGRRRAKPVIRPKPPEEVQVDVQDAIFSSSQQIRAKDTPGEACMSGNVMHSLHASDLVAILKAAGLVCSFRHACMLCGTLCNADLSASPCLLSTCPGRLPCLESRMADPLTVPAQSPQRNPSCLCELLCIVGPACCVELTLPEHQHEHCCVSSCMCDSSSICISSTETVVMLCRGISHVICT